MAHARLSVALRILCTKCAQGVRVRYARRSAALRDTIVVTECCRRIYGYLDSKALDDRPDDLTTNDIHAIEQPALGSVATDIENHMADQRAELEAIRWVLDG